MRKTILIADDHVDTVEITQGYLALHGYDVLGAYGGREAIKIARECNPDSILLDIALPEVDGFEVAKSLRQSDAFSNTVIIGYSGYGGHQYYDRARDAGFDYYLVKPTDPEVLIACLEPEHHPLVVTQHFIVTKSKQLRETSLELLSKAQALSLRSAQAVKRAHELVRKSRSGHQKP